MDGTYTKKLKKVLVCLLARVIVKYHQELKYNNSIWRAGCSAPISVWRLQIENLLLKQANCRDSNPCLPTAGWTQPNTESSSLDQSVQEECFDQSSEEAKAASKNNNVVAVSIINSFSLKSWRRCVTSSSSHFWAIMYHDVRSCPLKFLLG